MSFANILSGPADAPPPRRVSPPPQPYTPSAAPPIASRSELERAPSFEPEKRLQGSQYETPYNDVPHRPAPPNGFAADKSSIAPPPPPFLKSRKASADHEDEKVSPEGITRALEQIESIDTSDVEGPGFEEEWQRYTAKSRKRAIDVDAVEGRKRKVGATEWHSRYIFSVFDTMLTIF